MGKPKSTTSRKVARTKSKLTTSRIKATSLGITKPVIKRSARAAARLSAGLDKSPPVVFDGPTYGRSTAANGATSMWVQIGPGQGIIGNYGSTPTANTPRIMRRLLDSSDYNYFGWIAGHLLNDNLGGPGASKNLTPLTTLGNKNHLTGCETQLKTYIDLCYRRTWANKTDGYWYGVEYQVIVGDEKWGEVGDGLLEFVATELRVWASPVYMSKATDLIFATPATDPMYFAPIVNLQIVNTGFDQI